MRRGEVTTSSSSSVLRPQEQPGTRGIVEKTKVACKAGRDEAGRRGQGGGAAELATNQVLSRLGLRLACRGGVGDAIWCLWRCYQRVGQAAAGCWLALLLLLSARLTPLTLSLPSHLVVNATCVTHVPRQVRVGVSVYVEFRCNVFLWCFFVCLFWMYIWTVKCVYLLDPAVRSLLKFTLIYR